MARRFAVLAFVTAGFTYALTAFGGIVRITGSGMGCGDDWPLCNGQLFPEGGALVHLHWTHRLIAYALVLIVVIAAAKTQRQDAPSTLRCSALVGLIPVLAQVVVAADNAGHRPDVTPPALEPLSYSSLCSSTRRFCARPSGVALLATGSSGP